MSMADNDEMSMRNYAMMWQAGTNHDAIGKSITGYGRDRLDIKSVERCEDTKSADCDTGG